METLGPRIDAWIRSNATKVRRISHWLQVVTGLVLVALAWQFGKAPVALLAGGSRATGEIVRFEEVTSASGRRPAHSAFHPVVEFTVSGQRVQFRDRWGSGSSGGVHARVPVLFDPKEPSVALIDRPLLNWIPWAPILAVGVFLVVVGLTARLRARRA